MRLLLLWMEDRALALGYRLVPTGERDEWLRSWKAEVWYERSRGRHDLSVGLIQDALWLRLESWRQTLTGTAFLCLVWLSGLAAAAAVPALLFGINGAGVTALSIQMLPRFVVASGLTLFVSYASSFANVASADSDRRRWWLLTWVFHSTKVMLLLLLSSLVSLDLCLPLEAHACFAAMPLELLLFVILALVGLRWNLLDGQTRCKHCLRSLAPPQRIGRPSWNFLEYNGTEFACRDGHGLLTVPELETSWCRSSAWISQQC